MRFHFSLFVLAIPAIASAHVSISSGPAQANKTQIITFSVGHGCEDASAQKLDTVKIRVVIPAGVTSVRALRSDFGAPTVNKTGSTVNYVEWTKPASELLEGDDAYYEIKIRARIPDVPLSKLEFDVIQTCQDDDNASNQVVVAWDQPEGSTTGEPAAMLTVVPARTSGWNKYTMGRALTQEELPTFFGDAQIVWKGSAAYSPNQHTAAMITSTAGVTALSGGLAANDEIWVKY